MKPGWRVDWRIRDHYQYLPKGADVRLRYTDLTTGAGAYVAEAWVVAGGYNEDAEQWIPRVMVRRQTARAPLASTFVSVVEPYETTSNIVSVRRLPLETVDGKRLPDSHVAVEVQLADGRSDLITAIDVERPLAKGPRHRVTVQEDWHLRHDGDVEVRDPFH